MISQMSAEEWNLECSWKKDYLSLLFKTLQCCQSIRQKSAFLTVEHRCLRDQTPAGLRLWPCLRSVSATTWCSAHPRHCVNCAGGPVFFSHLPLANRYRSSEAQLRRQLPFLRQLTRSSFTTLLYLVTRAMLALITFYLLYLSIVIADFCGEANFATWPLGLNPHLMGCQQVVGTVIAATSHNFCQSLRSG